MINTHRDVGRPPTKSITDVTENSEEWEKFWETVSEDIDTQEQGAIVTHL